MSSRQPHERTRAEQVRARREGSQKRVSKDPIAPNVVRKSKNTTVPVSRRPIAPTSHVTRKKNMAYVPLNKKGVEIQLPVLPRLNLGWRAISGAVFLLSLAVIISFTSLEPFKVSGIKLKGANRLTNQVIFSEIDLSKTSIIKIVPDELQAFIERRFPSLKSVSVSIGLPATVNLEVIEREPIILWHQDNAEYWIDADGIMFPVFGEAHSVVLVESSVNPPPPLNENISEEEIASENTQQLFEPTFFNTMPEFVQAVIALNDYIPAETTLQYSASFGLGWRDPKGWLVYFGKDSTDIVEKLAQYQTIIEVLEQRSIYPALISLEFLRAPYYRLEH